MFNKVLGAIGVVVMIVGGTYLTLSSGDKNNSSTKYASAPLDSSQAISIKSAQLASPAARPQLTVSVTPNDATVDQMMSLILSELRNGAPKETPTIARTSPTKQTVPTAVSNQKNPAGNAKDLQSQIVAALSQGQSDAYIDGLISKTSYASAQLPENADTSNGQENVVSLVQKTMLVSAGATGQSAKIKKHTVKRGESLATISIRYYGHKDGYAAIFKANKAKLASPDKIRVGQVLLIPAL